jgi:hypothetical protein
VDAGGPEDDEPLTRGQVALCCVVLVLVGVGLAELARAVLPGDVAGVVRAVIGLLGGLLVLVLVEGLIDNRPRRHPDGGDASRTASDTPAVPRPPRSRLWLVLGIVVGVPFAVVWALAGPVLLVGWPWEIPVPEDGTRWLLGFGGPVASAFTLHELVRALREEPRSRATIAAVVAGSAVRYSATVSRRGVPGLTLTRRESDASAPFESVTMHGGGLRGRRRWKPSAGDEVVITGDLRERAPVLVTTADGARWYWVESVGQAPSTL